MAVRKITIEERLKKLSSHIQLEFETHYIIVGMLYSNITRFLLVTIEYPLAKNTLFLTARIPKTKREKCFNFLEKDFIDRMYEFINFNAEKFDFKYGKQRRK